MPEEPFSLIVSLVGYILIFFLSLIAIQNDEKKNNCHKWLLDSDRVQVINTVYFDFEQIWNSADCDS